jgi:geranylgeranyl pyrophosphate synthase
VDSIRQSGSIEGAIEVAQSYVRDGLDAIVQLPNGPERLELEKITRSVVERNE